MADLLTRMSELDATPEEVGELIGRAPARIEAWCEGSAHPDDTERILLRPFLADDPTAAAAALDRIHTRRTQTLRGGSGPAAGIIPPYGAGYSGGPQ